MSTVADRLTRWQTRCALHSVGSRSLARSRSRRPLVRTVGGKADHAAARRVPRCGKCAVCPNSRRGRADLTRGRCALASRRVQAEFDANSRSVRDARSLVVSTLRSWQMTELERTASLLTSELATNAVVHGGTPYRITIELGPPNLRVLVEDRSHTLPCRRPPDPSAISGRGLSMVDAFALDWGARRAPMARSSGSTSPQRRARRASSPASRGPRSRRRAWAGSSLHDSHKSRRERSRVGSGTFAG